MTSWHQPGEPARDDPAPPGAGRHSRQALILGAAIVLLAAAVVLGLVAALGGSDGPAAGSPEALTDSFASALHAGDARAAAALGCPDSRASVRSAVRPLLGHTTAAARAGSADVRGTLAVARIAITETGAKPLAGTLALRELAGHWCVAAFGVGAPIH